MQNTAHALELRALCGWQGCANQFEYMLPWASQLVLRYRGASVACVCDGDGEGGGCDCAHLHGGLHWQPWRRDWMRCHRRH
mmetsp:Transcript_89125/g.282030  ORF Transcript_89125/g.282030 Transcript_89125/m.282030 type:complete len:81 (-) Transcript_89125:29-271(-)